MDPKNQGSSYRAAIGIRFPTFYKPDRFTAKITGTEQMTVVFLAINKPQHFMKSLSLLFLSTLFTMTTFAQNNQKPVDRLGVTGPVKFDNKAYNLSWSAHPSATYYKQEYMQAGEDVNKYKSMLMVEAAKGSVTPKAAMDSKIAELKEMGFTNPFISYENFALADKGEYILDFVVTQNTPDNKSAIIAERNVYRYRSLPNNGGVVLFAISVRSYGADTKAYLANIKTGRNVLVDKVKAFSFPDVKIK